jgi:hypothetical protein
VQSKYQSAGLIFRDLRDSNAGKSAMNLSMTRIAVIAGRSEAVKIEGNG